MKKKVLLLDIDYTVINTDSMIDFIIYSLKTKTIKTLIKIPYIFTMLLFYSIRIVSLKKAKEAIFYPIVDYSEKELEEFFTTVLEKKINKSMIEIIIKSKNEGAFILMVTASPYAYMKYFKKYAYADEVLGTDLAYENLKYANLIIGDNCKGKEKIIRIRKILNKENIDIDFENSFAYSDSQNDIPMLSLVKNAYLVNKKNGQVKVAINSIIESQPI